MKLDVRETKRELVSERVEALRHASSVAQTGSMQPWVHAEVGGLLIFFCIHSQLQLRLHLHGFGCLALGCRR
jgi:hypothetical protein